MALARHRACSHEEVVHSTPSQGGEGIYHTSVVHRVFVDFHIFAAVFKHRHKTRAHDQLVVSRALAHALREACPSNITA